MFDWTDVVRFEVMNPGFIKLFVAAEGGQQPYHLFSRPDDSRPHDHPFDIDIEVVQGSYIEEVFQRDGSVTRVLRSIGDRFVTGQHKVHRIAELPDGLCITRCIYGPWVADSGVFTWVDGQPLRRTWAQADDDFQPYKGDWDGDN